MAGLLKAILFFCIFYCVAAKSLQRKCGSANFITPHQALCDRYYLCKDGELDVEKCPEGKLFNSSTLQCENKEDVDCGKLRIPNGGNGRSIKNRLLNDVLDIDYIKWILDVADLAVVNSKITVIDSDLDL